MSLPNYQRYVFFHTVSNLVDVDCVENITYGYDNNFYYGIIKNLRDDVDSFYNYYYEDFNLSDYDLEYYLSEQENILAMMLLKSDYSECDIFLELIELRAKNLHQLIAQETVLSIKSLTDFKDFVKCFLNCGIPNDGSYFIYYIGDVKMFAPYFLERFHNNIKHRVGCFQALDFYRESIEQMCTIVKREDWPMSDVAFGRFLELVNIYNELINY